MARIRTIKPSFFKNEELAELPMSARLLFVGLWCLADREGRLEDRPKRIKAELFPYDSIEIDGQLSRLQSAGFIHRYEVGELKVIQIINFSKHQRITGTEATSKSELPELSGNNQETLGKQLGNTQDDRKGVKERKGEIGKDNTGETPAGVGEAAASPPDAQKVFKELKKEKSAIAEFIKTYKPDFIEPYLELWNLFAKEKKRSAVSKATDTRKQKFHVRRKEKGFDFLEILKKAGQSEFLLTGKWFGWDWIFKNEVNWLKVIEGNYDNKDPGEKKQAAEPAKDLQQLYDLFLQGTLDRKQVKVEHYETLPVKPMITEDLLGKARYVRARGLAGSNASNDLRLLEDYQSGLMTPEIDKDFPTILRIAKRLAVVEYFEQLKSVNQKLLYGNEQKAVSVAV